MTAGVGVGVEVGVGSADGVIAVGTEAVEVGLADVATDGVGDVTSDGDGAFVTMGAQLPRITTTAPVATNRAPLTT